MSFSFPKPLQGEKMDCPEHHKNFEIPDSLTESGKAAAKIIRNFCWHYCLESSHKVFHAPEDFDVPNACLIVCHENNDANRALSMDGAFEQNEGDYELFDTLFVCLEIAGYLYEQQTRSYSAVFSEYEIAELGGLV